VLVCSFPWQVFHVLGIWKSLGVHCSSMFIHTASDSALSRAAYKDSNSTSHWLSFEISVESSTTPQYLHWACL
jgi:hypothetical protein